MQQREAREEEEGGEKEKEEEEVEKYLLGTFSLLLAVFDVAERWGERG
jgi:hypothetical protein